jgi:hypothetical protein
LHQIQHATCSKPFINELAAAQIGVEHRIRPRKLQQVLPVFTQGAAEDGPAKHVPAPATVTEFHKVPGSLPFLIPAPGIRQQARHILSDIPVELAATDVANFELFKDPKEFLIKKTAVEPVSA